VKTPLFDSVSAAAAWLASTPWHLRPRPIVPALRRRFGLSVYEAIEAIRAATLRGGRAE